MVPSVTDTVIVVAPFQSAAGVKVNVVSLMLTATLISFETALNVKSSPFGSVADNSISKASSSLVT